MRMGWIGLVIAILAGGPSVSLGASLTWNESRLQIVEESGLSVQFDGCQQLRVSAELTLPTRPLLIALPETATAESLQVVSTSSRRLDPGRPVSPPRDFTTSADPIYTAMVVERNEAGLVGSRPIEVIGELQFNGIRYADLLAFPVTIDPDGQLWLHETVELSIDGRIIASTDLIDRAALAVRDRTRASASSGPEYLIVTSNALAEALQPLVEYKNETGYLTVLETIEDILPQQVGRDDAEKLRERLKTFHAAGGRYLLLAGDETILPIRYAHHNDTRTMPPPDLLQVCDLYFADLTGDWDTDGDNVWGEKYSDRPDVVPELRVGRLPINSPQEATNYVKKLIRYETDPGGGSLEYLERSYFFSSDQMRDYGDHGQHGDIASAYPAWFEIDTVTGVEQATGEDANPTNAAPDQLAPVLLNGFGIINVIAHGRSDGFTVRSAGFNGWPKSMMLTGYEGNDHGTFGAFSKVESPAFYYSLACDNAAFDKDQPPFDHATTNMAQELIGDEGGAVGLVAYTRWGWISSSYLLQKEFFDSLFAHPERPAVDALYASKAALYYYRDLVYGLNYFGDPTLKVYTRRPDRPEIDAASGNAGLDVTVTVDGSTVPGCDLVLAEEGQFIGEYTTDQTGVITIDYPFDNSGLYCLSTQLDDATITQYEFIPALITGVDDDGADEPGLPHKFALHQNYPNPFNPSTTVAFDLPHRSPVKLTVFNVLGQTVNVLIDDVLPAGNHEVAWDGRSAYGEPAASGIYLYRLESEERSDVKKMILLK